MTVLQEAERHFAQLVTGLIAGLIAFLGQCGQVVTDCALAFLSWDSSSLDGIRREDDRCARFAPKRSFDEQLTGPIDFGLRQISRLPQV